MLKVNRDLNQSKTKKYYCAIDGNQVGRQIQIHIMENDIESVVDLSNAVISAIDNIKAFLIDQGCEIIFAAGDSVMALVPFELDYDDLPIEQDALTFSVGIGKTPRDALIALAKAKTSGLGKAVRYEDP